MSLHGYPARYRLPPLCVAGFGFFGGRELGAAQRGNEAYILGQRAAMRSRLVHAALAKKLSWGSASLAGFAPATAVNLDSFDEQPDDAMA